ncbi:hypothetical protein RUE5091_00496 [Ruegeria denitrificans]|uniref:DUF4034 domain-containing protein n=1 Tax=Ruegeria denitrificans TaxID=1715692 RepID=A0A0P1I2E1_9RHOB|nr:hypothetical protein [Ruegeria denitrificans]CUJ86672.1 hypothetical protein RUE5091_00496 [Ruegeria denitrificans]
MFRFFRARQARSPLSSRHCTQNMRANDFAVPAALPDKGQLNIPVASMLAEDLIAWNTIEEGRTLARQDRWAELSKKMRAADQDRKTAPDGTPIADLLAFGARSDVVLAAEHALTDGNALCEYDLLGGISELEDEMREYPDDPMITLVVALAHIDLAWAWRGIATDATLPPLHQSRCAAHFDRAADLLPTCRAALPDSPIVAAASCALLAGQRKTNQRVAEEYEHLITLDPHNQRHMRAMGTHLLPRWFGSYEKLEVQALRNAARTADIWGAGGYTWVQFDAIALDEEACARLDVEYFLEGFHDILHRRPDQQTVNMLSAYCAITIQNGQGLNEKADLVRSQIHEAANGLIRDHMTELHPLIWAHAANGFNNSVRINSAERFAARGKRDALLAIRNLFREELHNGMDVTFTPSGLRLSQH